MAAKATKSKSATPRILAVKASAGAGKTYQLTIRFLELLRQSAPAPQTLRQIVAITFTNRAAAEMKDRIILALKHMALATDQGKKLSSETKLKPAEAGAWLDTILDHYGDFQVRTIDSLIYTLMRAFAIEMGLPPELEVDFDRDTMLDRCFDKLLASVAWENQNDPRRNMILQLLDTYLNLEKSTGMVVQGSIRRRLKELYGRASDVGDAVRERTRPDIAAALQRFDQAGSDLLGALRKSGLEEGVNRGICKLEYLVAPSQCLDKNKAMWGKRSVQEFLKKDYQESPDKMIASLDRLFGDARRAREDCLYCHARLRVYPYVVVLNELQKEIRTQTECEGIVIGGNWLQLTQAFFRDGRITAGYAFVKMGSQIRHFLMDEFQDTSRSQWQALLPLVEESLSVGGTLFYVGDVKQAIYNWRGSDWRLFGEVVSGELPSVSGDARAINVLGTNYRSLPAIVDFNNRLYGTLKDLPFVLSLAEVMLQDKTSQDKVRELASTIIGNFEDVDQRISPKVKQHADPGEVHRRRIAGSGDEITEAVRANLIRDIRQVWAQRQQGIAILVRRNNDAEAIAAWLVAEGIPIVTENSLRLKTSALIKGIVSLLHFLEYPLDDMSFWGALASPLFRSRSDRSDAEMEAFTRQGRWKSPLYRTFEKESPAVTERLVRPLLAASSHLAPYELVREVIDRFELLQRFPEESVFIYRFLEVAFRAEENGYISLSLFLQFWDEGGMEEQIGLPDDVSAVRILTIHKAKGLEFPVVFVPFTNWMRRARGVEVSGQGDLVLLRSSKDIPLPTELEEAKLRSTMESVIENLDLLYVATTRPREELYLYVTYPTRNEKAGAQYLATWLGEMIVAAGLGTAPGGK